MIEEGKFRPDLFYRLNVFRIELPALRERREDIPAAGRPFRAQILQRDEQAYHAHFAGRHERLAAARLAGNVRELENAVERAMVVAQEPELREQDFASEGAKWRRLTTAAGHRSGRHGESPHPARSRRMRRQPDASRRGAGHRSGDAASQAEAIWLEPHRGGSPKIELNMIR